MSNALLDAAIEYASKGLAVFPLKASGKDPITKNGVLNATTNFDIIEEWWRRSPNANIGIACGQPSGGLLVVDVDVKKDEDGFDSLHDWEKVNGKLPETVMSKTGTGGAHILFYVDHVEKNRVGVISGVDIRADGGYIVAPPSVHPNGNKYVWDCDPDDYEIAKANESLLKLLSVGRGSKSLNFSSPERIQEGERNYTIYRTACSLQSKGLADESIFAACLSENETKCVPPLPEDEVRKAVESALKFEKGVTKTQHEAKELELLMVTDAKGNEKIRQCGENVARIMLGDPAVAGKIKDDTFGHRLMYLGQLDWREPGDTYGDWTDKDDSAFKIYLDIKYNLRNKSDYENGFNAALLENRYNPLVGFLDALVWDGKPRIDTVMTDYLGVEPTLYNISAFHVFLQGAIRRAYKPGCKFDYMLVLTGKQGDGKSTFFKMLACNDEWYDENFNFKDTTSKSTIEQMAGKWFLEMGEMDTMKKDAVTADALKAFVTSTADTYRVPFSRRPERRLRQCVFCGTSNDINFLKDRTGNRRYLPIDCHATDETKRRMFDYERTRPYFKQVIAEAVAYYKKHPNDPLVLPYHLEASARKAQLDHLEEDVWVSIIDDYLEADLCGRVNAAYLYKNALGKDPSDMRKGEISRILTIMRNDIKGWHEIGKARLSGYGKNGVCFERDEQPVGGTLEPEGGVKSEQFEEVDGEIIPF